MSKTTDYCYTTNKGDYLVIWITGSTTIYIAEVTDSEPLMMKVQESGPYAHLKFGDFIIREKDTELLQKDDQDNSCIFLKEMHNKGIEVVSGLKSLGIKFGLLRAILPPE